MNLGVVDPAVGNFRHPEDHVGKVVLFGRQLYHGSGNHVPAAPVERGFHGGQRRRGRPQIAGSDGVGQCVIAHARVIAGVGDDPAALRRNAREVLGRYRLLLFRIRVRPGHDDLVDRLAVAAPLEALDRGVVIVVARQRVRVVIVPEKLQRPQAGARIDVERSLDVVDDLLNKRLDLSLLHEEQADTEVLFDQGFGRLVEARQVHERGAFAHAPVRVRQSLVDYVGRVCVRADHRLAGVESFRGSAHLDGDRRQLRIIVTPDEALGIAP